MAAPENFRFPYPAFKESAALRVPKDRADFHFSSLTLDERAWSRKANGLPAGHTVSKCPRFPPGKLDPRIRVTAAPDVFYETDTGNKSGVARAVTTAGFTVRESLWDAKPRFQEKDLEGTGLDLGPGQYFNDAAQTPIRTRTAPFSPTTTSASPSKPSTAPVINTTVTHEELLDVVMHHTRRQKHLQQRRFAKKSEEPLPEVLPTHVADAAYWTSRVATQPTLSIAPKGHTIPRTTRFSSGTRDESPIGPGKYEVPDGFRTKMIYQSKPSDEFPRKRPQLY